MNNYSIHFNDKIFADFTLKSSDKKVFKVHRLVLATKSEYFEKMFTTDMQEKKESQAVLHNVHSTVLEQVIKYIYTGNADLKKTKKILDAAEYLGITGLKSMCEKQLLDDLKDINALEMLKTADMYNIKELEYQSLQIIIK
jgi:hypothetical protein